MNVKIYRMNVRPLQSLLAVTVLTLFGNHSLQSQIVIKQKPAPVRPSNPSSAAKPTISAPLLKWNNGESIDGELIGSTASDITWKTSAFSDPLVLSLPYLNSLEFPQQDKESGEPLMVTLRNGDRLFGQIIALDDKTVTLRSECHGDSVLLRPEVTSVRRLRGNELIYSGPVSGTPWRAIGNPNNNNIKRELWKSGESNKPVLGTWNASNFMPLFLPENVDVALHITSTAMPQFRVYLNSNYGVSPSIETWDSMLVLVHDGHFAVLRTMKPEERDVNLRICWNQKEKRCAVYTMEGEKVAELVTKDAAASEKPGNGLTDEEDPFDGRRGQNRPQGKPEAGICIRNLGLNLTLESLRVKQWSGEAPPKFKLDQQRIELVGGGVSIGKVLHADTLNIVVQSGDGTQKTIPLDRVEAIVLASDSASPERTSTELLFADGTFLSGQLLEIKNDSASIKTPNSANPILSKITALKKVRLRVAKSAGDPVEPTLKELDQLVMGKSTLHGIPVGSGDAQLRWMPVGGLRSIPLASGTEAEMIRGIKSNSPIAKAPALFFLKTGDILPGELKGMDENFVNLHTSISTLSKLSSVNFNAIQFAGPDYNSNGFNDPGWRVMKGDPNSIVRKDNEVTIKNGGAFGHSSVLQADEITFNIQNKEGYGASRLSFFVNDGNTTPKTLSLLLMISGNEIYCGQDDGNGQFQQRAQTMIQSNKPTQLKLVFSENSIEIFVSDISLYKMAALPAKREGLGLVFSSADVWGNGEREVSISNFSAHVNLERGWFPAIDSEAHEKALLVPRFRRDDLPTHVLVAANGDLLRGHIEEVTSDKIRVRSGLETVNIPRNRVSAAIWLLPPSKDAADKTEPKKKDEKTAVNEPAPEGARIVLGGGGAAIPIKVNGGGVVIVQGGGALKIIGNGANAAVQIGGGGVFQGDFLDPFANDAPENDIPNEKPTVENSAEGTPGFTPTHWLQLRDGGRIALAVDRFDADRLVGHTPLLGNCEIPLDRIHIMRFKNPGSTPAMLAYQNWRLQHAPEPVLPETGGQSSPQLGKEAKDFRLSLLGGGDFVLGNEKGKVIVLDFWATWCGPCVQSLPGLIEAMKPFDDKRVKFIGVNQGEDAAQVKSFLEQRGWKFTVALDATQSVAQQFGVSGIPHTVIIGPDGKVAWVNTGYRPGVEKDAAAAVTKLLESAVP